MELLKVSTYHEDDHEDEEHPKPGWCIHEFFCTRNLRGGPGDSPMDAKLDSQRLDWTIPSAKRSVKPLRVRSLQCGRSEGTGHRLLDHKVWAQPQGLYLLFDPTIIFPFKHSPTTFHSFPTCKESTHIIF